MSIHTVALNDGSTIPAIAFGTGTIFRQKDAAEQVARALESGFRHIDAAALYENEESVGAAIRESGIERSELFITTKYGGGDVRSSIECSLRKLGVQAVDLYLVHLPQLIEDDFEGAWAELAKVKEDGLTRSIGVSNFSVEHLRKIMQTGKTKPAVNQIRLHPYNYASYRELFAYAAEHAIVIEAFGSLAPLTSIPDGPLDSVLHTIAARVNATPAQVIFKWALSKGVVVVTTTSQAARLAEYLAVAQLDDLTNEEIAAIDDAGLRGACDENVTDPRGVPVKRSANWPTGRISEH
ncbi:Aldo/keto reductase [Artomyces pyxidatus]|uniref:Aldo/keto reductase n=1 Tax=Artomyces pyxidatus TaxID=48021 RepID=A0ACB8SGV2_9AGAM|nr:Aldo/keto reductase [Artomyces pyxidatus]